MPSRIHRAHLTRYAEFSTKLSYCKMTTLCEVHKPLLLFHRCLSFPGHPPTLTVTHVPGPYPGPSTRCKPPAPIKSSTSSLSRHFSSLAVPPRFMGKPLRTSPFQQTPKEVAGGVALRSLGEGGRIRSSAQRAALILLTPTRSERTPEARPSLRQRPSTAAIAQVFVGSPSKKLRRKRKQRARPPTISLRAGSTPCRER